MKLPAYTLIEGVVAMVILSILMSVAVMVSFNLFRSFPAHRELTLQRILHHELDSLIQVKEVEPTSYVVRNLFISYKTTGFEDFTHIRMGHCTLSDSLGNEISGQRIFYTFETDDE